MMVDDSSIPRGRLVATPVPCAQCHRAVDPIRAPHVAIYNDSFRYFCSLECRQAFGEQPRSAPKQVVLPRRSGELSASVPERIERGASQYTIKRALYEVTEEPYPELAKSNAATSLSALGADRTRDPSTTSGTLGADVDVGTLLLTLSIVGSLLSLALALTGDSGTAIAARLIVATVAGVALVVELSLAPRNALSLPTVLQSLPSVTSVAVAVAACLLGAKEAPALTSAAALVIASTAIGVVLVRRCRNMLEAERAQMKVVFEADAHRVHEESVTVVSPQDLRPGEEILVSPGQTVPADGTVVAGQALIMPWHRSSEPVSVTEGANVVAGASIVEGRLRIIVSWSGLDRAWLRLTVDPRRRADMHSVWAKTGRLIALRLAPIVAGLTALTIYAAGQSFLEILGVAAATYAAFCSTGLTELPALHVARGVATALRRGIAFRSAQAVDKAGRVSTATFCARGTLLLGEPEVTSIDPFGSNTAERVLELAAGAQSGLQDPISTAILRAARSRTIRPDAVRSPTFYPGLGVSAIASDGQRLIVGSRGLLLKEYVSVALAETKVSELESLGRSVLLVALGARVIGAIGLQDGMRPGARAAVQHLLDVNIEPVLLSGDTRDTCEALGQALDIDHVRPEVLPSDRGDEIRRLIDGGAVVAVIGRSPVDDNALMAADLAVALTSTGASSAEFHVQLSSDDVRDAAFALRIGHHVRRELWHCLLFCVGTATAGAAVVAFSLLPIGAAPILALLGIGASVYRWHTVTE